MQKLKILDLFSGIGGFSIGLERTGKFETTAFCEIEPFPRKVLEKRWPGVPVLGDLRGVARWKWKGSRAQTYLRQAFRVRTYHTLERVPDFQESVLELAGGRRVEPFAWYDHGSRCWRTWQRCLIEDLERWSGAWPRSGMTRNGIAYQLAPLAHPTSGIGYGLWHTPKANDAEKRGNLAPEPRNGLAAQVQHPHLWPTPQARDYRSGSDPNSPRMKRKAEEGWSMNLNDAVRMFPTPRASDGTKATRTLAGAQKIAERCEQTGSGMDLGTFVKLFPTPRASEYKDSGPVGSKSHSHMLSKDYLCAVVKEPDAPNGKLNPQWVEWLMGYPIGHTELNPSETASSPSSPKSSAGPSGGGSSKGD